MSDTSQQYNVVFPLPIDIFRGRHADTLCWDAGKYGLACLVESRCEQTRQMLMSATGSYLALLKAGRQPLEAQPGLGY